jgi:hypothetical protein
MFLSESRRLMVNMPWKATSTSWQMQMILKTFHEVLNPFITANYYLCKTVL